MAQEITVLKCHAPACGLWIAPLGADKPCVCGAVVLDLGAETPPASVHRLALEQYTLDVDMAMSCAGSMDFIPRIRAKTRPRPDAAGNVLPLLLCGKCVEWKVEDGNKECSCGARVASASDADDTFPLDANALVVFLTSAAGSPVRDFILSDYHARGLTG